jgi:hypothetical protein
LSSCKLQGAKKILIWALASCSGAKNFLILAPASCSGQKIFCFYLLQAAGARKVFVSLPAVCGKPIFFHLALFSAVWAESELKKG